MSRATPLGYTFCVLVFWEMYGREEKYEYVQWKEQVLSLHAPMSNE